MPILHTIPTRNFHPTDANTANAVVNLSAADDNQNSNETQIDKNALTFLQEWDAFYNNFIQSMTYTLVHASATSNLPSPIDDDND